MTTVKPKSFLNMKKLSKEKIEKANKALKIIEKEVTNNTEVFNGVYLIHNTFHNKKYIGSSKNINRRFKTHKRELEMGSHNNRKMQKDYDIAGPDKFNYIILEKNLNEELLTAYEKYYMYIHDSIVMYKGYNDMFPTTNHILFKQVYKIKQQLEEINEQTT
jgi:group I intron endonuclease